MDNLSDYIPLIIIAGSLILSVMRGKKKKEGNPFEKMELPKGIGSENKAPQPKPVIVSKPKEKQKAAEPVIYAESSLKKTPASHASAQENFFEEEQSENTNSILTNFSNTDELKRAIIYSEILQRKEY